jgi:filamentous hemagglutinin family protein
LGAPRTLSLWLGALVAGLAAPGALAQVVFDGSLGEAGPAPTLPFPGGGVDYRIEAARGQTVGPALFQSLARLDVGALDAATFTGPDAIDQVYVRVTGGAASNILGALRSEIASADLFLSNPDGVILGRDARLDLKGSFRVSTAEELRFPGGERFEARAGGALPALAVDPPEAFGFLPDGDAGSILVDGSQLFLPEGETFQAVAGEVVARGRPGSSVPAVQVPGGGIELAAAAPGALVPAELAAFDPRTAGGEALGAVELSENAILAVTSLAGSGARGTGRVVIRGGQLALEGGQISAIARNAAAGQATAVDLAARGRLEIGGGAVVQSAATATGAPSGAVRLAGDSVALSGASLVGTLTSGAAAGAALSVEARELEVDGGAQLLTLSRSSGPGGPLRVVAQEVALSGGGQIATRADAGATGKGGDLEIAASRIRVATQDPAQVSQIAALTLSTRGDPGAGAPGGRLRVQADSIDLEGGGQIRTTTLGTGPAGDLEVRASDRLRGSGLAGGGAGQEGAPSGLFARSAEGASGPAGSVRVGARVLELEDGAEISARSFGTAAAGDLTIEGELPESFAERVTVRGGPAGESTLSVRGLDGPAGALELRALRLELLNGGVISASTLGRGDSGAVRIAAPEVLISGVHAASPSGVFAQTLSGRSDSGNAGDLELAVSKGLRLEEGARLSVASRGGGAAGDLRISGGGRVELASGSEISARVADARGADPADVRIRGAEAIRLSGSTISAETAGSAPGGAIELRAGTIELAAGSLVTARSSGAGAGSGDAGHVTLAAEAGFESIASSISTDAEAGGGGRISISAGQLVSLVDSSVTTSVRGQSASRDAGNIDLPAALDREAGRRPDLVVLNRSQITANAVAADAGNIRIAAASYLQSADSLVQAKSELGIDGLVQVEAASADIAGQVTALPVDFVDAAALLTTACAARTARAGSFVVQARAAPPAPARAPLSARLAEAVLPPEVSAGEAGARCASGKEIR